MLAHFPAMFSITRTVGVPFSNTDNIRVWSLSSGTRNEVVFELRDAKISLYSRRRLVALGVRQEVAAEIRSYSIPTSRASAVDGLCTLSERPSVNEKLPYYASSMYEAREGPLIRRCAAFASMRAWKQAGLCIY